MNLRKQLSSYIALNNYVEAIRSGQLPAGYTELEYIESTGTQYIDTGVKANDCYGIYADFTLLGIHGLSGVFGSNTKTQNGTSLWLDDRSSVSFFIRPNTIVALSPQISTNNILNTRCVFSMLNGVATFTYNNVTSSGTYKLGTTTYDTTIKVCGCSTFYDRYSAKAKYNKFMLYEENNTLIRNFIPAMRNSDNVLGMYDTVSGAFFTNSGTGNFIAGPVYNSPIVVLTDAITNGLTDLQLKGSEVKNKPEVFLDSVVAKGGTEQNGTPTPDAPMDIVCNNGVLKVSPNLFDKNASYALFNGYINNVSVGENTTLMTYSGGDKTIIIKVAPNTTYTVTRATNLGSVYDRIRCAAFTTLPSGGSTGVILCNYMNKTQANATFTTLSDTQYVAINVRNSGTVGDDWTQFVDAFQLEQGSTATQYRPYGQIYADGTVETIKDSLNNTATAEMLLKVGDYQDVQEILSGNVTRKIGVKVLDGTEDWIQGAASPTFKASLPIGDSEAKDSQDMLCSHFKPVKTNVTSAVQNNQCAMFTPGGASAYDKLVIGKYDMPNLTAWKQWLADQYAAGTPIIVIYPLNASTTETVSPQKLFKNPVTVTEASIDNLEVTTTEAEHTVPMPDYPLDIVCNNGVLKVGPNNSVIVEGTPETVTITGKNLLDINKTSGAGYLNTSGELVPFDNYYCSDYIEIKPSTVYTYTETMKSADRDNYIRFCFYDSNKTFIPPRQGNIPTTEAKTYTYKITSPVNAKYIRISSHSDFVKGQLEESIRLTKYEEYYQASFAPEDLLKLGDYQDIQSVLDGIVTRNVGIKVLDGTENWTRYEAGRFATPLIGSKKQDNQEVPISTHFIGVSNNNVPGEDGSMAVFNGSISSTSGALGINYQATPEVEQFKQWLADQYAAGTPVIVVYPLADTVEETVESRDVFITSGTNTIERNSEYVSSGGITVKYKKLR